MVLFQKYQVNYRDILVYLPGWATDESFVLSLKLPFQIWCPCFDYMDYDYLNCFETELKQISNQRVSILGVSLGGYMALHLLQRSSFYQCFVWGVRPFYDLESIQSVRSFLNKNLDLYLMQFYKRCFGKAIFLEHQAKFISLSRFFPLTILEKGLCFLSEQNLSNFSTDVLRQAEFSHGGLDEIAPSGDLFGFLKDRSLFLQVFDDIGHLPFYFDSFRSWLLKQLLSI